MTGNLSGKASWILLLVLFFGFMDQDMVTVDGNLMIARTVPVRFSVRRGFLRSQPDCGMARRLQFV